MMDLSFLTMGNDQKFPISLHNSNGNDYPIIAYDFNSKTGLLIEKSSVKNENIYIVANGLDLNNPSEKGYSWANGDYYNSEYSAFFGYIEKVAKYGLNENFEELLTIDFLNLELGKYFKVLSGCYNLETGKVYKLDNIYINSSGRDGRVFEVYELNNPEMKILIKDKNLEDMCNHKTLIYTSDDDLPF